MRQLCSGLRPGVSPSFTRVPLPLDVQLWEMRGAASGLSPEGGDPVAAGQPWRCLWRTFTEQMTITRP